MTDEPEIEVAPDPDALAAAADAAPAAIPDPPEPDSGSAEPPTPAADAEPGPAPWHKELEARFPDEAVRAEVDRYMREVQAPYVTRVETERAEALERSWLLDNFDADPEAALADVAAQLYPEVADRIVELVKGGATPDAAVEQAEAEAEAPAEAPTKLSAEQEELLAWAKERREAEAGEAKAAEEATALAEATEFLNGWLEKQDADIKPNTLRAYVVAAKGDLDAALSAYREEFPAPVVEPEAAPRALPNAAVGMYSPPRSNGSTSDAVGNAWDRLTG